MSAVAAAADVPGVLGVDNGSDLLPVSSPYVWTAKRAGKVVTLSGNVPSESTRNAVLAGARRALPDAEIRDEMTLARGAAANFNSTTAFALDRLGGLTEGTISVTDGIVSVSGVAASSTSYAEARGAFLASNVSCKHSRIACKNLRKRWRSSRSKNFSTKWTSCSANICKSRAKNCREK